MNCSQRMRVLQSSSPEKIEERDDPDFAETVELCFKNGPSKLRPLSGFVKHLVNFFICLTQVGFCCIYIVFISTNFEQVGIVYHVVFDIAILIKFSIIFQLWNFYMPNYPYDYTVKFAAILLPILAISMITELKYLAPLSTIANICMAAAVALTFYFAFQDLPSLSERSAVGKAKNLPLFFGTAIFAFEGIALVLPLKNAMKKPKLFARPSGVLNVGMVFVASLFVVFGMFSYWKWGDAINGTVTLNLPEKDP